MFPGPRGRSGARGRRCRAASAAGAAAGATAAAVEAAVVAAAAAAGLHRRARGGRMHQAESVETEAHLTASRGVCVVWWPPFVFVSDTGCVYR